MNLTQKIITAGAVTVLSFSVALIAQERQPLSGQSAGQTSSRSLDQSDSGIRMESQQNQQEFGARHQASQTREKASELKGAKVKSQSGEDLGKVEDVAVNLQTGELEYLLVGAKGSNFKPLPPEAAQISKRGDDLAISVNIDKDRWEEAPTVEKKEIAQLGQAQRGQEIQSFYGQESGSQQTQFGSPGQDRSRQDSSSSSSAIRSGEQSSQSQSSSSSANQQEFGARSGQSSSQSAQSPSSGSSSSQSALDQSSSNQSAQSPSSGSNQSVLGQSSSSQSANQQEFGARSQTGTSGSAAMSGRSGKTQLGSELMDSKIQDSQDKKVGEIEDLVLNLEEGRVDLVLFKAEDADGTFAVAPSALRASGEKELQLNISKQDLESAQALNQSQIDSQLRQSRMSAATSQQSPQVYRWEGERESSIFGSPGRDRSSHRESEATSPRSDSSRESGMSSPQSSRGSLESDASSPSSSSSSSRDSSSSSGTGIDR